MPFIGDHSTALVVDSRGGLMSAGGPAAELLGLSLTTGQRLPADQLFKGAQLTKFQAALTAALSEAEATLSGRIKLSPAGPEGGQPVEMILDIQPLIGPDDAIIGAMIHLTPEPKAEPESEEPPGDHLPRPGYEAVVDNLAEGLFTINTSWRITSFNRAAEEITGFLAAEVLGHHCWDIFRSDLCDAQCPLRTTMDNGQARMDQDVRILDKGGSRQAILVNTSVLKDSSGNLIGAVETFRPLAGGPTNLQVSSKKHRQRDIIGRSTAMSTLFDKLEALAASEANVLIQGESGTGKELFARAIHSASSRAEGPFVAVNCSALAETLLESELFGHEKAAFTGAVRAKVGRFELAKGGTIFLDEIGELKPELQVKLLRVLEEKVFERVGGTRAIPMQARIISATNRDLVAALKSGVIREDLFYRLRTVPLELPPLRERKEDISLLVEHFIDQLNAVYRKDVRSVDPKVMKRFMDHPWPGNVRELERVMEHAFVFVKGPVIFEHHLPDMEIIIPGQELAATGPKPATGSDYGLDALSKQEIERQAILRALQFSSGRRSEAASLLGISRTSLWRKMKALGIEGED